MKKKIRGFIFFSPELGQLKSHAYRFDMIVSVWMSEIGTERYQYVYIDAWWPLWSWTRLPDSNDRVRLRTTGLNFEPINMIVLCRRDCMKDDFVRHPGELEGGGGGGGWGGGGGRGGASKSRKSFTCKWGRLVRSLVVRCGVHLSMFWNNQQRGYNTDTYILSPPLSLSF